MKVHFIRHTSVDVDNGICYGQSDVPVKDSFVQEADVVKANLQNLPNPDAVFSSPLSRCVKLAHHCDFTDALLDKRLKEIFFGDWELCRWNDLDMEDWTNDWISNPPPNGESLMQMYARISHFLDELKETENAVVYIFAHAGVINCAKVYFGQATLRTAFDNTVPYGSIVTFDLV